MSSTLLRYFLHFRLRTLFLATLAVAIACCWFTPFTQEERRPDGTLKARYRVRRDWHGTLIAAGEQWEFFSNGRPERCWTQYVGSPGGECDGRNCTHWEADGRRSNETQFDHLI